MSDFYAMNLSFWIFIQRITINMKSNTHHSDIWSNYLVQIAAVLQVILHENKHKTLIFSES